MDYDYYTLPTLMDPVRYESRTNRDLRCFNIYTLPTPMDPVLYKSITSGDLRSLNLYSSDDIRDKTTVSKNTALHVAAQSGVFSSSEVICNLCPSLALKTNANDDTPLHIAARDGRTEIVRLLIKSQHQHRVCELLRMRNKRWDTALHMAVRNTHFEVVKLLTEADPKPNEYKNNAGETPLYLAAEDRRYQMVEHILTICPSSSHDGPGLSTLQAAILHNHSDITNLLMKKDLKVIWQVDYRGWTVLHCAARVGNVSVIKDITERYPDIWEAVDDEGCNFLHHAAWYDQIEVVKYVLGNNATTNTLLNGQTRKGDTPLHHAAYKENKEIVLLLMSDKRVNLNTMNNENLTVLERTHKEDLVSEMKKAGVIHSRRNEIMEPQHKMEKNHNNSELKEDSLPLVLPGDLSGVVDVVEEETEACFANHISIPRKAKRRRSKKKVVKQRTLYKYRTTAWGSRICTNMLLACIILLLLIIIGILILCK